VSVEGPAVLSAAQAREVDRLAARAGLGPDLLVESAGRALADEAGRLCRRVRASAVVVLCGKGNNGADGLAAARHLADRGVPVAVGLTAPRGQMNAQARRELGRLAPFGVPVRPVARPGQDDGGFAALAALVGPDRPVAVDAILGSGARGPLLPPLAVLLAAMRRGARAVLAADLPTGVSPDGGDAAPGSVFADCTLAMDRLKLGHLLGDGAERCGRVVAAPIGLSPFLPEGPVVRLTDAAAARELLPKRPPRAHKGSAGHLLVVAGRDGMGGAAVLATLAALRSGAGLVTAACPDTVRALVAQAAPEALTAVLPTSASGGVSTAAAQQAVRLGAERDAVALGPGLGRDGAVAGLVEALLSGTDVPAVVDADGLNAWADAHPTDALGSLRAVRRPGAAVVITPHPAEMGRLCGLAAARVDGDRVAVARRAAAESGAVVVLKGHPTVVASPQGGTALNGSGGPVLAVGGSGDVLTGLLGGLLAQGMDAYDAARLAVYVHGVAGDLLAKASADRGRTAVDIARGLPAAWRAVAER
jgi:hydroxyethylthiazole kinase-like uncharacterized protein yjeF